MNDEEGIDSLVETLEQVDMGEDPDESRASPSNIAIETYLSQACEHSLLTKQQEERAAKRIEITRKRFYVSLLSSAYSVNEFVKKLAEYIVGEGKYGFKTRQERSKVEFNIAKVNDILHDITTHLPEDSYKARIEYARRVRLRLAKCAKLMLELRQASPGICSDKIAFSVADAVHRHEIEKKDASSEGSQGKPASANSQDIDSLIGYFSPKYERIEYAQKQYLDSKGYLVSHNLRLAFSWAKRMNREGEDLIETIQHANLGLMTAVDKFDYHLGNKFSTHATWWIKQSIGRERNSKGEFVRIPSYLLGMMPKIQRVVSEYNGRGQEATPEQIADDLGYKLPAVRRALSYLYRTHMSLDPTSENTGGGFFDDYLIGEDKDPATAFEDTDEASYKARSVKARFALLTGREAEVVMLRYGFGKDRPYTLDEVGQTMNPHLTRERVRQIEASAIKKLRIGN